MKVIIDIPEEMYKAIGNGANGFSNYLHIATRLGTPLSKGHGRLIDISPYEQWFNPVIQYDDGDHIHQVYTKVVPTIIEADEGE